MLEDALVHSSAFLQAIKKLLQCHVQCIYLFNYTTIYLKVIDEQNTGEWGNAKHSCCWYSTGV